MKYVRLTVRHSHGNGRHWGLGGQRRHSPAWVVATTIAVTNMLACVDGREYNDAYAASTRASEAGVVVSQAELDANALDAATGKSPLDGDCENPSSLDHSTASLTTAIDASRDGGGCAEGTFSCDGDKRTVCVSDGTWQAAPEEQQCAGALPVCTDNGVCAAFRLRGNIAGLATSERDTAAAFILQDEGFLTSARVCSELYCVSGGLAP